ncbi:hypothetical protein Dda_7768 [Drechslerella dactyloides]|uniref:Uncharacterized protein n=1 Tax=Drechslerella dactyloides TaxID=74499 RepID=A0AAD6NIL9_DREDA|nr:hypothetical protein Dda_7768 [Drechslerella dactyloides]
MEDTRRPEGLASRHVHRGVLAFERDPGVDRSFRTYLIRQRKSTSRETGDEREEEKRREKEEEEEEW